MSDEAITYVCVAAVLVGAVVVFLASRTLTVDKETKAKTRPKMKVASVTRSTPPERFEHHCARCGIDRVDPPNELLRWCTSCGNPWTWTSPVVESVPAPDEPPTLPEAS
jgi:hypothetical protein